MATHTKALPTRGPRLFGMSTMIANHKSGPVAYIQAGYVPWWRLGVRMKQLRYVQRLIDEDIPGDAGVKISFTRKDGTPDGKWRTLRERKEDCECQ